MQHSVHVLVSYPFLRKYPFLPIFRVRVHWWHLEWGATRRAVAVVVPGSFSPVTPASHQGFVSRHRVAGPFRSPRVPLPPGFVKPPRGFVRPRGDSQG